MQLQHTLGISALHCRSDAKNRRNYPLLDHTVCAGLCRRLRELQVTEEQLAGWKEQINVQRGEQRTTTATISRSEAGNIPLDHGEI
jgi:hypothetical protein